MNRGLYIYDCECLPYFFSYTAINIDTKKVVQFQISSFKNEIKELVWHLQNDVRGHVGYNNIGYDSYLVNYLYDKDPRKLQFNINWMQETYDLNRISNEVINAEKKPWIRHSIPQQDLYKMYHYDSNAKATSLKWIEFMMDFHNIQDVDWKDLQGHLTQEQINLILGYNLNDVMATLELYNRSTELITIRRDLTNEYGVNLMSASEPRIVKEVFAYYLTKALEISNKELRELRTPREVLYPKEFILPEIEFTTPLFQSVLESYKNLEIRETKGAFEKEIVWKDCNITYALGGIHGATKSGVYQSDAEYTILSVDVKSFYPNLAIKHKWSPAHFDKDKFCQVYESFYIKRLTYPKSDPRNYLCKIILNSAYGLSNEENSYLYDPLFTMQITINGQLLLSNLLEKIANKVEIKPILINTDGFEIKVLREDLPKIMGICGEWETMTKLELEYLNYEKMVISDVNNYLAVDEKGKLKTKGKFEWERLPYHKNKSYGIIPKALQMYFIKDIPIKQTIESEDNIFLFCRGIKAKKDSWFEYNFMSENELHVYKLQKVNRFYISKRGGKIIKHYSDGRKSFVEAKRCNEYMYNVILELDPVNHLENVNRSYYILEANKIINEIISTQQKLF